MSQTLCTLSSLGRNSSSEGSHLFRSHGTWTTCHNENQAWRTDLCSGQVRGLHTAIPELPQAFVHLAWKWSLLTYATHTEFICISLSPLGHCGSDLRKGCLGQAPSAAERQTTKATPRSFPEWAEGHRATAVEGACLTSIPTSFLEQQNSHLGQAGALPPAPISALKCLQVAPHGPASVLFTPTIARHPLGPTLFSLSLPHALVTPTITDARGRLAPMPPLVRLMQAECRFPQRVVGAS